MKDEFSKGSIPLGKVTAIQRHEHKKKFIFEIVTTVEGRIFYILCDSEASMKDWMDAIITTWTLHIMKDKYKEKFYHGADNYLHTIINMAKRVITTVVRMTGVTKAVITGGGRANKAKPAEAATIYADNAELGAAAIEIGKQVLITEKDAYKYEARKSLERAVANASRLAELIGGRGVGSVNEGACASTSRQLVTEINNMVSQTYPPSMKTNILYLVHLHASVIEKFSTATNVDLKSNESKRLEELGKAFPIIAKEVFPHIPDLTYAQPLLDGCSMVPRITFDVRELVKSAAVYTAGETYATNASKTLFYLLNDIRRNAMSGFPPGPYDSKFPQVGPPDAQFQLSSEQFASNIAGAATDDPTLTNDPTPQLGEDMSFDDLNGIPPPPPDDEEGSVIGSCAGDFNSLTSSDPNSEHWGSDQLSNSVTMPINLLPQRALASSGGPNGMFVGSAPTSTNSRLGPPSHSNSGPISGKLASSQGASPITFGGPAPNTPVPSGRYGSPGVNPAPGSYSPAAQPPPTPNSPVPVGKYAAPGTNPAPGSYKGPIGGAALLASATSTPVHAPNSSPGSAKFAPPTPKVAPGTPGSLKVMGSAKFGSVSPIATPPGTPPPFAKTPVLPPGAAVPPQSISPMRTGPPQTPPTGTPPSGPPTAYAGSPGTGSVKLPMAQPKYGQPNGMAQPKMAPQQLPPQLHGGKVPVQSNMAQQQALQQQQQLMQQQQQQLAFQQQQQQLLLQQQQQEAIIKQQQEEIARQQAAAEEARKAEEQRLAEEARVAAESAKHASALDELAKLEWNI